MENKMFCYQCQETARNTGCTIQGVCGKKATTAIMQDLLIYVTKGLSAVTTQLRKEGKNHLIIIIIITFVKWMMHLSASKATITEMLILENFHETSLKKNRKLWFFREWFRIILNAPTYVNLYNKKCNCFLFRQNNVGIFHLKVLLFMMMQYQICTI